MAETRQIYDVLNKYREPVAEIGLSAERNQHGKRFVMVTLRRSILTRCEAEQLRDALVTVIGDGEGVAE